MKNKNTGYGFLTMDESTLKLDRCPYCSIDRPNLSELIKPIQTTSDDQRTIRFWKLFWCRRCGGVVLTATYYSHDNISELYPEPIVLDECLPPKVKFFLQQAIDTIHSPSASIMVCCSAVDEMLKVKGYTDGKIYPRIKKASEDHLLTDDMTKWAHQVRLDANDQRHADQDAVMPTTEDATRTVTFASSLAEFLFVLPSKVTRGIEESNPDSAKG